MKDKLEKILALLNELIAVEKTSHLVAARMAIETQLELIESRQHLDMRSQARIAAGLE